MPVAEDGVPEWLARSEPAPGSPVEGETDARQVFRRLAGCWTYWGFTHGYFGEEDAHAFYDELQAMLARQAAAPNSPQWFNTGPELGVRHHAARRRATGTPSPPTAS